jgi:predicted DNA-binding ribbon-helix-helix protein
MAMRMTTVRLSEALYQELQSVAEAGGVSVAQWLREAAIAQLNFERGLEYARLRALSDAPSPPTARRSQTEVEDGERGERGRNGGDEG